MRFVLDFILGFIACLFRVLFAWIPRNKKKWVFSAHTSFRDNPKYLFLSANESHKEIRAIWISHNHPDVYSLKAKGFEAYFWLSFQGIYHTLTAKVFISDHQIRDVNMYLSGGVFYVNLWHGVGIKKVRWQAPEFYVWEFSLKNEREMRTSFIFRMLNYSELFIRPDLLLSPSEQQMRLFYAQMLDVNYDRCLMGIPPRSRLLIEGKERARQFIKKYEPEDTLHLIEKLKKYKKVYIYMPTWRSHKNNFVEEAEIDWDKLSIALKKNNAILLLRLHMFTKMDLSCINKYDNIIEYPRKSDIYTVLPFTDCLITDYSSIYTDFLTMNKETILFIYDYDRFIGESHTLEDYEKYYLGTKAYNFNQLVELIASNQDCHIPKDKYDYLMQFFWDNNSHDIDIVEEIKKRLN